MVATNFLSDLEKFRAQPKESLNKLATRVEDISSPLLTNKQISARHLTLHFCTHLPTHIRKRATSMMDKENMRRDEAVPQLLPTVNKDREKHFPLSWDNEGEHEKSFDFLTAVAEADLPNVHYTPMYIDNISGVLDANGYVPKETILDTGATKVMISKAFVAALKIDASATQRGGIYVTASGSVEQPLRVIKEKLKFTMGRNNIHKYTVELVATVVDTPVYDVLLGMEFIKAVKGAYDSYTETFTYRWINGVKGIQRNKISAPCHTLTPPIVTYAYFGGLISGEEELQDVQSPYEEIVPEDDSWGYLSSPLHLAATQLRDLSEACEREEEARQYKKLKEAARDLCHSAAIASPPSVHCTIAA